MDEQVFFEYITKGGIRWDQLSYQAYGTAFQSGNIIRANPDVPVYDILPDGLIIKVPVLPTTSVLIADEKLPPWKRTSI